MDTPLPPGPSPANLEALPDDELRTLIERARRLLAAREAARRKEALARIRAMAKEHGLSLDVKAPPRRRGRPPKAADGS